MPARAENGDFADMPFYSPQRTGPDLWHDSLRISVSSLRAFLQSLLARQTAREDEHDVIFLENPSRLASRRASTSPEKYPEPHSETQQQAVSAAQAYQRAYDSAHPSHMPVEPPKENIALDLTDEERILIETLVEDLAGLTDRDIDEVDIARGENFIQNIMDGIQAHAR